MIAPYKRVSIAILSTTLLHASLFYSLNDVKEPKIAENKTIEIELMQEAKEEIKEIVKEKIVEEKPKRVVKAAVKQEPKAVVKPKAIVVKEEVVQEVVQKAIEENVVEEGGVEKVAEEIVSKKESEESKPQESLVQDYASDLSADILESYLYRVRVKIEQNLRYPPLARRLKIEGESVVAFNILSDGSVESSSISSHKSSGNSSLDNQAIETILQLSPFEAPPKGKISIIVPLLFTLS